MYELREVHGGTEDNPTLDGVDIYCGDSRAVGFRGGLSLMITTTAAACPNHQQLQQFLHGIVLAMSHCCITGSIPTVVDR